MSALSHSTAQERDGRKGSLAKFCRKVGFVDFTPDENIGMPCSEVMAVSIAV